MNTLDKIFPNGPYNLPRHEPESGARAMELWDTTNALKGMNEDELTEVLADLPPTQLTLIYRILTDMLHD